jgi:hypothetical protein
MTDDDEYATRPNQQESIVVIESSPIAFAIVGPSGRHRAVLVRSALPCLDLIGLSRESPEQARPRDTFINRLLGTLSEQGAIQSAPVPANFMYRSDDITSQTDERSSKLTFSWRGFNDYAGMESLTDTFTQMTPDLVAVLKKGYKQDIEWQVAPLILRCIAMNNRVKRRMILTRVASLAVITVYFFLALYTLGVFFGHAALYK